MVVAEAVAAVVEAEVAAAVVAAEVMVAVVVACSAPRQPPPFHSGQVGVLVGGEGCWDRVLGQRVRMA